MKLGVRQPALGIRGVGKRKPHLHHALLQRLMPTAPESVPQSSKGTKRKSADTCSSPAKSGDSKSLQGVELMRQLQARARSLRCVDGCMCALHMVEHACGLERIEAVKATSEVVKAASDDASSPSPEEAASPTLAQVAISPYESDDILHFRLVRVRDPTSEF